MKTYQSIVGVIMIISMSLVGAGMLASAEEIELVGTDDGEAIFEAVAEAFNHVHSGVTITLPDDIGSTGAIKMVGRDEQVLGRVARDIRENEQHYGLTYVPLATTAVVFFVNTTVGVETLSAQQILDIYSGKITSWQDVGGPSAKVRVITHEEGDSNREVLEDSFPGFDDITITSKSKTIYEDEENIELVQKTKGAIGYGNAADVGEADVIIVRVDGKGASDPEYPYVSTLGFVYKEENYSGTLKTFIEFTKSEAAHEAITEAGGVPLQ